VVLHPVLEYRETETGEITPGGIVLIHSGDDRITHQIFRVLVMHAFAERGIHELAPQFDDLHVANVEHGFLVVHKFNGTVCYLYYTVTRQIWRG
jgi:hypothetical protein